MSVKQKLGVGCYRLAAGVRINQTEKGGMIATCDYPLRVVPLNPTVARLLSLCVEERTCEQLAMLMHAPLKRIEALCDQLRWKSLLDAGPVAAPVTWPAVTIIIPGYNRANELERCLRSLFALQYPHSLIEILVVDDASTDSTHTMLLRLVCEAKTHAIQLRCIQHERQQGVAKSRNTGTEAASHDLIAYIDSDCVATTTWLTELVPLMQDSRIAAVGGMIRGYEHHTMLGRYEDVCSSLYMGTRSQQVRLEGPLTYLPTANLLVRRSVWQDIGGFAPLTQGEDVDFCRRVLLTGAHIRYEPQGVVYHDYRTTMESFLKIRTAYATAEAALLQLHPTERRILLLPPEQATFAGLVLGGLWGLLCVLWLYCRDRFIASWAGFGRGSPSTTIEGAADMHRCRRVAPPRPPGRDKSVPTGILSVNIVLLMIALLTTLFSTYKRMQKIRQQHVSMNPVTVFKATLRGNLAYIYHLCRHITRYYTLPLLLLGIILFPFVILIAVMLCIVVAVDYVRLKPEMNIAEYALCTILSDCAYEIGIVQGCTKHRTWKPLVPILKKRI